MKVVGDGGGTTKTQVMLEVQIQLITEIAQCLIVMKTHASTATTKSFQNEKILYCESAEPKMSRSQTVCTRSTAFLKKKKCRLYCEVAATLSFLNIARTRRTWQSQTSNLSKTSQSILVSQRNLQGMRDISVDANVGEYRATVSHKSKLIIDAGYSYYNFFLNLS